MTIIRERQRCPALREDSTSEHHTLPTKTLMNSDHSQDWMNCSSLLSCKKKWSLNVIPLSYYTRWPVWLSEMDGKETILRVWFNDREGTAYIWPGIFHFQTRAHSATHSFYLCLLPALLERGTGLGTRNSCPRLLEGCGRSYITTQQRPVLLPSSFLLEVKASFKPFKMDFKIL